jgi:NADH dehydrogenase
LEVHYRTYCRESEVLGLSVAQPPRIVILGAGFGGQYAARELAKLLHDDGDARIILADRNNYLLFTPFLTEVVGGQLSVRDVVGAVRDLPKKVSFEQGTIVAADLASKRVTLLVGSEAEGIPEATRTLEADHLVVAMGAATNFRGIEGLEEHSFAMTTTVDAVEAHHRAIALLERASEEPDNATRRELLTFVVGGGGFSGVETMAALNGLLREAVGRYSSIPEEEVRTILVHHGARLLPELGARLASYAQEQLERRGVEVILNTGITGAGADHVELSDGRRIGTREVIWTGGVAPNPIVEHLDARRGHHGGLAVDHSLAVPGHSGVWAIGDCAEIPVPGKSGTYGPTAQNATREGAHVARNIVRVLNGEEPKPFKFRPMGELALVGKRSAVAEVFGLRFSGILAWAMWRAVYLYKMPGAGKRVRVVVNWLLDTAFGAEIAELRAVRPAPPPSGATEATPAPEDVVRGAEGGEHHM